MKNRLIRAAIAFFAVCGIGYAASAAPLPFVQQWWNAPVPRTGDLLFLRHRIADGLVVSQALIGRSRVEIERKLGPANEVDYGGEPALLYRLGSERGFIQIDDEWLIIRLDAAGVASDVRVSSD